MAVRKLLRSLMWLPTGHTVPWGYRLLDMSGADRGDPAAPGGEARPRLRRADAERSRDRILSPAAGLFERDPGASMTDVAAAAGVGRSTLHRHFSSRRELWRALAPPSGDVS